ncbi:MAG TPA: RteC domain-containing protein [Arenibacter sp.]|nr:RteC domain-containing protein [Arenibacter sp.]
MDWVRSHKEIESELITIEQSFDNRLVSYNRAISYCQRLLEAYRNSVVSQGFPDELSEIRFFKKEKPFLFGQLLKYSHQLTFELDFPNMDNGMGEGFIKKKIQEVNSFLADHKEMIFYLELGNDNLDSQYFLRKNRHLFAYAIHQRFGFDTAFSSSHDGLLADILGYQGFLGYLHNKLGRMSGSGPEPRIRIPALNWTGSKVALTELGFALYHSGAIGHGNTRLKTIMEFLEQACGQDLGDYHHTSIRLRNRSNPTKFLNRLQESLEKWMAGLDD